MAASFSVLSPADSLSTLDQVAAVLESAGVAGQRRGDSIEVQRAGLVFRLRCVPGPVRDPAILDAAEASGQLCSSTRWASRVEVEFDDLRAVLDETNTLIELQGALQDRSGGFLYLSWNRRVSPPPCADQPETAAKVWSAVMKSAVSKPLKAAGFSKQGNNFVRRHGSATQRVSFRSRKREDQRRVELSVGWDLDEALVLEDTSAKVVVGGEAVMFHQSLLRDRSSTWTVAADTRVDDLATEVRGVVDLLLERLEPIDGPAGMLEHVDLSAGFNKLAQAQLVYLLGDRAAAAGLVRATCVEFADRDLDFDETVTLIGLDALVGHD